MLRRIDQLLPGDRFLSLDNRLFTITQLLEVKDGHRKLCGYFGTNIQNDTVNMPCALAVRTVERFRLVANVLEGISQIQQAFEVPVQSPDFGMVHTAIKVAEDLGWHAKYDEKTARVVVQRQHFADC